MNYVVGYAFSPDKKDIALIRKEHPDWQRGILNGIGGKIESFELTKAAKYLDFKLGNKDWDMKALNTTAANLAMSREFEEETGMYFPPSAWELFAVVHGPCRTDA